MKRLFTALILLAMVAAHAQTVNVTIFQNGGQLDPSNTSPIVFAADFSEAVTGFTNTDVVTSASTAPGTLAVAIGGSGANYTISVSGMTGPGTVIVTIPAGAATATAAPAGRMNVASTNTDNTVTFDNVAPSVTINQAVGQNDPTNGNAVFTAVFSEPINGGTFGPADVTLGGTATGQMLVSHTSGDNITWTITISATGPGTIMPSLAAGVVKDPALNDNLASTSTDNTVTFDNVAPSVTINQSVGQVDPTNVSPVSFTAVFSEAINPASFINTDVTLGGTATGKSVVSRTSGDNITWTITIGATGSGTIVPAIASSAVQDPAGNNNTASTFTDNTVTLDITPPTVNSNSIVAGSITTSGFTYRINVSEAGTTYWEVTTSATPPTGAQIKAGTGPGHVSLGNFPIAASTNTDQPIAGLSPFTAYFIYSVTEDALGNQSTPVVNNNVTTLCNPPSVQASFNPVGTVTASSITLNWAGGDGDNVIILARANSAVQTTAGNIPVVGTTYTFNTEFSLAPTLGSGSIVFIGGGTSATITDLNPSTTYHFRIYAFNDLGKCYMVTFPAGAATSQATNANSVNTVIANGNGAVTISSIADTNPERIDVFTFDVIDQGDDNDQTDILAMTFTQGPGNQIANWADVIAGVELIDDEAGSNSVGTAPTINPTSIVFPGTFANNNNEIGEVDDGETKTYTLRIWLKNNLPPALKSTIDGQRFVFELLAANVTVDVNDTRLLPGTGTHSDVNGVGKNPVSVVATQLNVTQQPSAAANATVPLPQQPTFDATDVNGNRDLDFNTAISVVNTGNPNNLAPAFSPTSFSSGVATFTDLRFNNTGTSTMSATAGITSANTNAITVTAATTLAGGAVGVNPGPNINNSATNQAVFGFSLQTTGSVLNFTGATVSTTSDPDAVFNNIRLFSSVDNDFGTAVDNINLAVGTTPGNAINFTGFASALSGITKFFFVVADVKASFPTNMPTIQLSLTTGNVVVSIGNVVGSTQTGTTYTFLDTTPPLITSITNTVNPIFEGALTQTVVVRFNESMKTVGFDPVISLTGTNWGAQTTVGWSTTTNTNDTYTATFAHSATQETIPAAVASVNTNTSQDVAGNAVTNVPFSSSSFVVDNQKPTATVATSPAVITTNNLTALQVVVTYNESMNTGFNPTIILSAGSFNPIPAGVWSTTTFTNDTYTVTGITHTGAGQTIAAVTATASGARDARGNVQVASPASNAFAIDTQRPTVVSVNRQNPTTTLPINNTSVVYRVIFSEAVTGVDPTDFTKILTGTLTAPAAVTVNPVSATTYDVTVSSLAGDGTLRLDILNTAILTDTPGNTYTANFTTGQIYTIDNTPPLLSALNPLDNKLAVPLPVTVASQWTITLNENVKAGTGNLNLRRVSDDVSVALIDINGPAVGISGATVTLTPSGNIPPVALAEGENYYIQIPSGVILDIANNAYAGFINNTSWNFQTFATPQITNVIKSASANTLAACVGETLTVTGSFFSGFTNPEGITRIDFREITSGYINSVVNPANITVISDNQLTVVVPNDVNLNERIQLLLWTALDNTGIGTNPVRTSTLSTQIVEMGAQSVAFNILGPVNLCNDPANGAPTGFDFQLNIPSGTASSYTMNYTVNGTPASFNYIRNSTNQFAPPTNPTPTFIHNYALTTIVDNFGCPALGVNTTTENITKYTRAIPTIDPVPPIILSQGAGPVTLTGHIEGSVTSGAWSSVGGLGSFAPGTFASGVSPVTRTTDYTFSPVDFTNPTITFRLTTPNAATVNPSNPCAGGFFDVIATISGTPLGNDVCTGDPTTTVTGFVSGNPTDATLTILSRVPVPVTPGFWQSNGNPTAVTQNPLGPNQSISQIYEWSAEEIANNTVITIQLSWTDGTVKTDDLEIKRQPIVTLGASFPTQFSQSDPELLIPLTFNPLVVDISEITFTGAGIRLSTAAGFKWFFNPGSVAPGSNPISFTYNKSGCQSTINTVVNVFSGGLIFASGPNAGNPVDPAVCVNDASFDIQLNSSNEDFSNVTDIQGAIVESFNPITKVARINPSLVANFLITGGLAAGDFEIVYFAPAFTGPRTAQTLTVNGKPSLDFSGFPTSFVCGDNANITLTKGPNNPEPTFSFFTTINPAIVTPAGGNNYTLDPRQAEANLFNLGDNDDFVPKLLQVFYAYTNNLGCGDTTSVMVNIRRQPPQPVLTDPDNLICVTGGNIQSISVANLANSGVAGAAALLDWSVSAAFVVNSNQVNFIPATLQQNAATPYFVRQSIAGCTSPTTNFLYERINFNDNNSNFNGSSFSIDAPITYSANLSFLDASISPATLEWQLVDNSGTITQTSPVLPANGGLNQHAFTITQANAFQVRSILETTRSCRDTLAVQVLAVEKIVVNDLSNAYEQDFEGAKPGLWIPTVNPSFTGWEQGVANKTLIQSGAQGNVWVTTLTGSYAVNQKYYLYSPSFDITGLGRPMLSLDHWVNADLDNDGAVLEFSVDGLNPLDPTKQWFAVGFKDSGRAWFTSDNLQSQVGSGRIIKSGNVLTGFHGWSGTINDWVESSFVLDQVKLQALASGNDVIFRMGFGSIGPIEDKDGFAFDNVRIGNRTRTVLLENFRNAGNISASEFTVNNAITKFASQNIGTQLLLLNYHVGFPSFDPFNEDNAADPSSRALFYGITQTPLSRLDGDDGGLPQAPFTQWGEDLFNIRTLQLGFATITFDPSTGSLPDGSIHVKASVTPFIDLDENTILHIAIVEDTVSAAILPPNKQSLIKSGENGFNFVVKKLLPSAVGTRTGFMASGVTTTFEATWEPDPAIFYRPTSGAPNLSVIIFLQNELTREVYQAEVITNIPYPPIITGLDDILTAEQIAVFPNPADQELTVQLPVVATRSIELQLVDQMGRVTFKGNFEEGEQEKIISTRNMAGGIYLLQLGAGEVSTRKKVMIVHK